MATSSKHTKKGVQATKVASGFPLVKGNKGGMIFVGGVRPPKAK